jgi:hypothetical protein
VATAAVVRAWAAVGAAAAARLIALCLLSGAALADEGGVSFWLPGTFGSFAAVPGEAGWSMPASYYHSDADGSPSDLLLVTPSYGLPQPIAGAQATLGVGTRIGSSVVGDLYPSLTLRTRDGVHHYMTYTMIGVPSGASPLGTDHWSLDGGGGYTYLDYPTGREFSAVLGFTYNFRNPDTDYRNGLSAHLDWAASQFISRQWNVGVVGYFYGQLAADSGPGESKSRVSAIGPQLGYRLERWYLNLKGYYEWNARNRPEGWNAWLTLAAPLK